MGEDFSVERRFRRHWISSERRPGLKRTFWSGKNLFGPKARSYTDTVSDPNTTNSRRERGPIDVHLSVLARAECRYVIYYFQQRDDEVAPLGDLAEFVASNTAETGRTTEQVRTILHHRSLPKLADCGVVEYDARGGSVRYHGNRDLEEFATIAGQAERRGAT